MQRGIINKIIPFSAVDGPGNRTVIFLQGCNFACKYCHNPETINFCTHCGICVAECRSDALSFEENKVVWNKENCTDCDACLKICPSRSSPKTTEYSVESLFEEIAKYQNFTSGITFSGGECTLQFNFLKAALAEAKARNISAFIDTNGFLSEDKMHELSGLFDKAMPDIKAVNSENHIDLTEKSNEDVLSNVELLLKQKSVYEIRTVIVPDFLDNAETVEKTAKLIAYYAPETRYKLIKYRKTGAMKPDFAQEPDDKLMFQMKNIAEKIGCKNVIVV